MLFNGRGVDRAHIDAALVLLQAAVAGGTLTGEEIRYILDRVRKCVVPRQEV